MTKQLKVGDMVRLKGKITEEVSKVLTLDPLPNGDFLVVVVPHLGGFKSWQESELELVPHSKIEMTKRDQLDQLASMLRRGGWVSLWNAVDLALENASDDLIDELYGIFYKWGRRG